MTVFIDDFITSDNVRAVLGVSNEEIPDEAILAMELEASLLADTSDWLSTYSTIKDEGRSSSPTADQTQLFRLLKLYAIHYCAEQLIPSIQSSSLFVMSDGNVDFRRFEEKDKFGKILERMRTHKNKYKEMILDKVTSLSASTYVVMGNAEADYDPITNT